MDSCQNLIQLTTNPMSLAVKSLTAVHSSYAAIWPPNLLRRQISLQVKFWVATYAFFELGVLCQPKY